MNVSITSEAVPRGRHGQVRIHCYNLRMAYVNGFVRRWHELGREEEKASVNTVEQMMWGVSRLYGHTQSRSRYTIYLKRGFNDGKVTETVRRWTFSALPYAL